MIVDSFFEAAEANKFLFAAVLFWKNKHDCLLMNANSAEDDDYLEEEYALSTLDVLFHPYLYISFVVEQNSTTEKPSTTKIADWREDEDERLKSYFNTYVAAV
jgi:hypothetical protein